MNNKYELMSIIDAQRPQSEKDEIYKQIAEAVAKSGGKVANAQVWQERLRMSFKIKKKNEATYYLVNFESDSSALAKMKEILRLNEDVLRFLIIKQ